MARIAIATENDAVWALTGWERALPLLAAAGHEVAGVWAMDAKLGPHGGAWIPLWYLRHLGILGLCKLGLFALRHRVARLRRGRPGSIAALAEGYGLPYFEAGTPNDAEFIHWMRHEQVDVLLISLGHILGGEALAAPHIGAINKHAGLLPANKGLWPYFWAVVRGLPQGISYHKVNHKVDAGPLLLQENTLPPQACESMIAYYAHVYGLFGQHMAQAVELLLNQHFLPQGFGEDAPPQGLPDKQAFATFRAGGGVLMRWRDLQLASRMLEDA